jgi:glyoxylase-like metal-dependent hydrolase (beta-lactamase superfamily II)
LKVVSPWDGKERWLDEFSCFGIPTPGHTTPHLSYFFPKERFLFSGDLVLGRGTPWVGPPEGDVELFLQSCERVLEYKPFTLYPGHGPVGSEKQVEETIRHKLFRIEEVYKVLTSPKTIQEIVEEIYIEKEGLFLEGMRRIVAEMSVEGYLTYLIRKGRVIRMGERYGRKGVFP